MFKNLMMILAVMMLSTASGVGLAQKKMPFLDDLKNSRFQLEFYDKTQYTGQPPITLSFNEIGNPHFAVCGHNIVTATPEGGVFWRPNSTFASTGRPPCQDQEAAKILDIYFDIMISGGSASTDKGETFYILTNRKHGLTFKRVK